MRNEQSCPQAPSEASKRYRAKLCRSLRESLYRCKPAKRYRKAIEELQKNLKNQDVEMSLVESHEKGSIGAVEIAEKIVKCALRTENFKYAYEDEDTLTEKIEKITTKIYGAEKVEYTDEAMEKIKKIEKSEYSKLPVCIAKTQYSFSDDPKNLKCKEPFSMVI